MQQRPSRSVARRFTRDYLIVSVVPFLMLLAFLVTGAVLAGNHVADLIRQSARELNTDARDHLAELGETVIRNRARAVARQVEILLEAHPRWTAASLTDLPGLPQTAQQPVGDTGYTCLYEADSAVMRIHPNPELLGRDMRFLAEKLPSWWAIFQPSLAGMEVSGYYDWIEPDGSIRRKFMTMTPVGATVGAARLMVAATTYIDEFSTPVMSMQAKAEVISRRYREYVTRQGVAAASVAFGLLFLTFAGVYLLGRRAALRFILPFERLAGTAERIGGGGWDAPTDRDLLDRRDEIGALAGAIESMRVQLSQLFERLEGRLSELKRTQVALQQSERHYRGLFDGVPVGIYRTTPGGDILDANPALVRMLGFPDRESFLERSAIELYPDPRDRRRWKDQLGENGGAGCVLLCLRRRDGSKVWVENYSRTVGDDNGGVRYYEGSIVDISDRHRMMEKLQQSEEEFRRLYEESRRAEELYRSLLHSSADAIAIYNMVGEVRYLSPAFTRLFGWTLEELKGRRIPFVPDSEAAASERIIRDLIENGTPCQGFETRRYSRDGRTLDVSISGSRYLDHGGRPAGMLSVLRDISETRRLEAQIQRAQRMEAIGTLAGGIAHDFNNLLMAIQGRVSLLLARRGPERPESEDLRKIEAHVSSATELTRQILGFARGGRYEVRATDINRLVAGQNALFSRTRKEIRITDRFEPDLWTVRIDGGQIEQVLLNLYVNAWQAMPGGGELKVATDNVNLTRSLVKSYGVPPGRYVRITVSDTGTGMERHVQERIFDPFFTTKEMGRGTGLGLASAYGIIKSHGGLITVTSRKGRGSTFEIFLPACDEPVAGEETVRDELRPGRGRILLVDDEEMIREIGGKMLAELGYEVVTAAGGRAAIDVCRARGREIDLVLLDVIMPDMDGQETVEILRDFIPELPVLLSSGYSIDEVAGRLLERGAAGFIQKPFTIETLSRRVSEIIASPAAVKPAR